MRSHWKIYRILAIAAGTVVASVAIAHEDHIGPLEEMVVYGRAEQQIGQSDAASSGVVGYSDIQLPPLLRVGELVESVPGMVATQHSGTGKANQYFLRGFNLDHGTDFAAHAHGVPLNMRSHGHGQGYLDLNFLIPEMVATTRYKKGPYHAEGGDFSSAGSVDFRFYERLPESLLSASVGEDDYARALAAGSFDLGQGVLTAALDLTRYDGPWDMPEDLRQHKGQISYATDVGNARVRLDLQGYDSRWNATDQVPQRAVESGLIDELGFIDPDLGGSTERYAFTGSIEFGTWALTAFAIDYDFSLFSNFTYFLDDPIAGDEFEQRDERKIYGLNVDAGRDLRLVGRRASLRWGIQTRFDDIDAVGLYGTASQVRTGTVREDTLQEFSAGVYGEAEFEITPRLRAIAGLRGDYYDWDVAALRSSNSGSGDDVIVSPKLSLAYRLNDGLEAYANWGRGFHSNDVRGATITVDPSSIEPTTAVDALVASEGAELGLRIERGERFNASVVGFWLTLDSELVFVGDAGGTEANQGSERFGVEAFAFWRATDWLAIDATYTYTDASFDEAQGGADAIPGSVESTASIGLNAVWPNGLSASARLRYLGEAPLVEDRSVQADKSLLVNASVGYRFRDLELRMDVFNLFNSNDHDISYYYPSRLLDEPAVGVDDIHYHPLEPSNNSRKPYLVPGNVESERRLLAESSRRPSPAFGAAPVGGADVV